MTKLEEAAQNNVYNYTDGDDLEFVAKDSFISGAEFEKYKYKKLLELLGIILKDIDDEAPLYCSVAYPSGMMQRLKKYYKEVLE